MRSLNHLWWLSPSNCKQGLHKCFTRRIYPVCWDWSEQFFWVVWFSSLNYLSFSLGFGFKAFLVSIIDNRLSPAHSNPKANLSNVFPILSESSWSVRNSKPASCLQLWELSVKHKSSYHKLSNWSWFVSVIPVKLKTEWFVCVCIPAIYPSATSRAWGMLWE